MSLCSKPKTIWGVIKDRIPQIEHHEAKILIGLGLIEQVDEIMAEMESFSALALFTSDEKSLLSSSVSKFIEFTPEIIREIQRFTDRFQSNKVTVPPNLILTELQAMKKHLERIQMRVFNSVIHTPRTSTTSDDVLGFSPSLAAIDDELTVSMTSRFSHCCSRCTQRYDVTNRGSPVDDWLQKKLLEETEEDVSSFGDENADNDETIIELPFTDGDDDEEDTTASWTLKGTEDQEPLEVPALLSPSRESPRRAALPPLYSFKRAPPLSRLHPPKQLRPVQRAARLEHKRVVLRRGESVGAKVTTVPRTNPFGDSGGNTKPSSGGDAVQKPTTTSSESCKKKGRNRVANVAVPAKSKAQRNA